MENALTPNNKKNLMKVLFYIAKRYLFYTNETIYEFSWVCLYIAPRSFSKKKKQIFTSYEQWQKNKKNFPLITNV